MNITNIPLLFKQIMEGFLEKHKTSSYLFLLLITLGGFFIDFKKANDESYVGVIKELRYDNVILKTEQKENYLIIQNLREEMSILKLKFLTLQTSMEESPFPMWVKSTGTRVHPGTMLYLNEAYENLYLLPQNKSRGDYVGKTDQEFWGQALGYLYWFNDLKVLSSGKLIDIYEPHPINNLDSIRVIKYPRRFNNTTIGVAGIAIPN